MRRELVPDELWARVEPLPPRHPREERRGRPLRDERACLRGIIFVLKTGIAWRDLPAEVFGCSGATCWRRLREWSRAGVFEKLQRVLLDECRRQRRSDEICRLVEITVERFSSSVLKEPRVGVPEGSNCRQ
jgi:transposase